MKYLIKLSITTLLSVTFFSCATTISVKTNKVTDEKKLKYKKIKVTSTNNTPSISNPRIAKGYAGDQSKLEKLRRYVEHKGLVIDQNANDLTIIKDTMSWVNAQWEHNGFNQPPRGYGALEILKEVHQNDVKYRCVEYGLVLTEILQAYGFPARTIAMSSTDAAYGGFGRGHVASEIWSNDLNKWIFFDPQFGVYLASADGKPLNYYEFYQTYKSKGPQAVKVNFLVKVEDLQKEVENYLDFISRYLGYISVRVADKEIELGLEGTSAIVTFQGMATRINQFTRNAKDAYPSLNKVQLNLKYNYKLVLFGHVFDTESINKMNEMNKEEIQHLFNQKVHLFAAKPIYKVKPSSHIPQLSHYEYRFDKKNKWLTLEGEDIDWDAQKDVSLLEVRGVTKQGAKSPITFISLSYK